MVGAILDAKYAKSHWAVLENTGAADVARLRGQFKCKDQRCYAAIATLLFLIYACFSIHKSLITTLLFWTFKVQAEGEGTRCYRHNELDDLL